RAGAAWLAADLDHVAHGQLGFDGDFCFGLVDDQIAVQANVTDDRDAQGRELFGEEMKSIRFHKCWRPLPSPSPCPSSPPIRSAFLSGSWNVCLPLPKGEGRGEGEATFEFEKGDIHAQVHGRGTANSCGKASCRFISKNK